MKRLALIVVLVTAASGTAALPGSAASFNDSAPCPASGPLLVCPTMNVGQAVHLQLLAHDGCEVYRWEIVNGGLPPGFSVLSGRLVPGPPTAGGPHPPVR